MWGIKRQECPFYRCKNVVEDSINKPRIDWVRSYEPTGLLDLQASNIGRPCASFIPKGWQTVAGGLNAVNTTGHKHPAILDPERVEDSTTRPGSR